jgi:hypothetical protein
MWDNAQIFPEQHSRLAAGEERAEAHQRGTSERLSLMSELQVGARPSCAKSVFRQSLRHSWKGHI